MPEGDDDALIDGEGLRTLVPGRTEAETNLLASIEAIRGLVREGRGAVRIAGFSGLGKTRLVQALFEEGVAAEPLDRATAIYPDMAGRLVPMPDDALRQFMAEGLEPVVVLDNCPPDAHARLAQVAAERTSSVRLLAVEYDVADDQPEFTQIVRVEGTGTAICETLVGRRFPGFGQANARRIAEFAEGNARIALSLAGVVGPNETLTRLSDNLLFARLFEQRQGRDNALLRAAEALSLVYSFSVMPGGEGEVELDALGGLVAKDRQSLHADVHELLTRQLAQRRGDWRAVLPTALGNRLARGALGRVPGDLLRDTFERAGRGRLLVSFARRLGNLHDTPEAVAIVEAWLAPGGLLHDVRQLTGTGLNMLENAAPAAPEAAFRAIVASLRSTQEAVTLWRSAPTLRVATDVLLALAHDPGLFEQAVQALATLARAQEPDTRSDSIRDGLFGLFALYLSGTEAPPEQRARIVETFLDCADPVEVEMGLGMLERALLKAAPDAETVFGAFVTAAPPTIYSGSGADVIARRRAALSELLVHQSEAIRLAAAHHIPALEELERRERESELTWAQEHDQRFE